MAFMIFFFLLKKFEKVEKTGIISTKLSLRCTPSVILGMEYMLKILYVDCRLFSEDEKNVKGRGQPDLN